MVNADTQEDPQSLRGYLDVVERDYPTEFLRIREPVHSHFDVTSIIFELECAGRSPVVVFERVENRAMPLVTNVAANRKLLAACMGSRSPLWRLPFESGVRDTFPVSLWTRQPGMTPCWGAKTSI